MIAAVVLIDPKHPHNVGGVVRACSIFGVPELRWTGERVHDKTGLPEGACYPVVCKSLRRRWRERFPEKGTP